MIGAMRYIALLLLACACGDDSPATSDAAVDAVPDSPTTPAIDWSIWGLSCERGIYGAETCTATDGQSKGLCILTGEAGTNSVYPGTCRPTCLSQPSHATECPADASAVNDGTNSQGCYCKERP
jgi:hypothetical protein